MARRASKDALNRYRDSRSAPASQGGGVAGPGSTRADSPPPYELPPIQDRGARRGSGSWTDVVRSIPMPRRPSAGPGLGDAMVGGVVGGALGRLSTNTAESDYRRWQVNPDGTGADAQPGEVGQSTQLSPPIGGPPDTKPAEQPSSGLSWVVWVFVLGAAVFFGIALWRRLAKRGSRSGGPSTGRPGVLGRPRWLSLARPLTLDPSPFVLAAQQIPIHPPVSPTGSGMVMLAAVGEAEGPDVIWHRGYLEGGGSFFQIHLDPGGDVDECRYFSRLDEVTPSDEAEWGFWLDPAEGVIGWPEFQTKDGKLYRRVWAGGQARVAPQEIVERLETGTGLVESRHSSMLYARSTGLTAPAPPTEYLLVAAVERDDGASVLLHVGMDLVPDTLQQT